MCSEWDPLRSAFDCKCCFHGVVMFVWRICKTRDGELEKRHLVDGSEVGTNLSPLTLHALNIYLNRVAKNPRTSILSQADLGVDLQDLCGMILRCFDVVRGLSFSGEIWKLTICGCLSLSYPDRSDMAMLLECPASEVYACTFLATGHSWQCLDPRPPLTNRVSKDLAEYAIGRQV